MFRKLFAWFSTMLLETGLGLLLFFLIPFLTGIGLGWFASFPMQAGVAVIGALVACWLKWSRRMNSYPLTAGMYITAIGIMVMGLCLTAGVHWATQHVSISVALRQ